MECKHTPGPCVICGGARGGSATGHYESPKDHDFKGTGEGLTRAGVEWWVADVGVPFDGTPPTEVELARALLEAWDALEDIRALSTQGETDCAYTGGELVEEIQTIARAALAKAKGEA